mmetsp:Transcript_125308/g.176905  ORF Transcript_125308/g.176905 Transcript_125308/m.176905 type:complete len:304 (-) Transcript_125308:281-1192(-)
MRTEVPKQQMVVGAIRCQLVTFAHQSIGQGLCIGFHLLGVLLEHWTVHLQELYSQTADLVIVGSTLQCWEDCHIDALLDVWNLLRVLEEDHTGTRPSQGLVRSSRHHVTMFERTWVLTSGHQTTDVCDVSHQNGTHLVGNLSELGKVDDTWIRGGTAQDHGRSEDQGSFSQLIEVDQTCLRMDTIWQRLEVDAGGADLLLGSIVAMSQMSTRRQVQAHDTTVRWQECCVDSEVGWASTVGLDIHTPFLLVQGESFQCSRFAQILHLIDDLIATIITIARLTLGVLVGQCRAQAFHDSTAGEVL